jgi:hypothetical protein
MEQTPHTPDSSQDTPLAAHFPLIDLLVGANGLPVLSDTHVMGHDWEVPVPGEQEAMSGAFLPRPYPLTVYQRTGDTTSGIAGTLYPDGRYVPLPPKQVDRTTRIWNHERNQFEMHEVAWDGVVAGSVICTPGLPHRRLFDGALQGDWPTNPPRAARPVNPERAREIAREGA